MKIKIYCVILACISFVSCNTKVEPYKAPWEVDKEFQTPSSWKEYKFAKAFKISIPEYMKEVRNLKENLGYGTNIFYGNTISLILGNKELTHGKMSTTSFRPVSSLGHKDAIITINYIKGEKDAFLLSADMIDMSDSITQIFCRTLITEQTRHKRLGIVMYKTCYFTPNNIVVEDVCFEFQKPQIKEYYYVHIFFLENEDKAVEIVAYYNKNDNKTFRDLFNIVNTFEWND